MYPADSKNSNGKLRLLYEAAPMAMICEQAGGSASDGRSRILDLAPEGIHSRTPLYIGSSSLVELAEQFLATDVEG
jgi:fructose-1,6-bisphosphatase I